MLAKRVHQISRIEKSIAVTWDNQFWPVAAAVLVTAGFAAGAIISALDGASRWTALLLLPAFVAIMLIGLQKLNHRTWRRSLQLAIVLSALVHFLILILAAVVDVFGSGRPQTATPITKPRPERVILTSRRDPQPIWKEINQRETVEVSATEATRTAESSATATETAEVSPSSSSVAAPTATAQRKSERSNARPVEGELSARQRQPTARPSPSDQATTAPSPSQRSSSANSPSPKETVEPSQRTASRNTEIRQREMPVPESSQVAPATASATRQPTTRSTENLALESESPATARLKNSRVSLPESRAVETASRPSTEPTVSRSAMAARETQPSEQRMETVSEVASSPIAQPRTTVLKVAPETARSTLTENSRTTMANKEIESATQVARANPSKLMGPTSSETAESPSTSTTAQSNQARSSLQAAASPAVASRSGAMATQSTNVQTLNTPSSGVAPLAADSARRERAESRSAQSDALSAMDQPQTAGRSQGLQAPQLAWQANTTESASVAGSNQPAMHSQEASAAQHSADSRSLASQQNVTPGQSESDIGPTRIAPDVSSADQGGGGAPTRGTLEMSLEESVAGTPDSRRSGEQRLQASSSASAAVTQTKTGNAPGESIVKQAEISGGSERSLSTSSAPATAFVSDEMSGTMQNSPATDILIADGAARQLAAQGKTGRMAADALDDERLDAPGNRDVPLSRAPNVSANIESNQTAQSTNGTDRASEPTAARESIAESGGTRQANLQGAAKGSGEGLRLEIDAPLGTAGLGELENVRSGNLQRGNSESVEDLQLGGDARFIRPDASMSPGTSADAVVSKEAFRDRAAASSSGQPSTEAAIELGLDFLARHQRADGHWSLRDFDQDQMAASNVMSADVAATGLAVLAFQGAGYTHREYKHAARLSKAIEWLIENQEPSGLLFEEDDPNKNDYNRFYSHAIATLALTEAYGMTQDPALREPCQRALNFITRSQDRQLGGWRYYLQPERPTSDTSVTGWMMMAMQSARLSDLQVDSATWQGIEKWLNLAKDPDQPQLFRYNPFAEDSGGFNRQASRQVSPSMTAVGLLMRHYMGWNRDEDRLMAGVAYLSKHLPSDQSIDQRDTYYWYYATQVLRHAGGESWETWNQALHPLLVNSQIKTGDMGGSWDPFSPVPDRWANAGGRLYVTTMNLLSLEVNYRLLPLYELE